MRLRRRPADPAVEAFGRVASAIDRAQRALLDAVPSARRPGAPLADALLWFERGLADAAALMPGWQLEQTAAEHRRCSAALEEARARAQALRIEAPSLGFEALAARLAEVMAPLEAFVEAERTLRR